MYSVGMLLTGLGVTWETFVSLTCHWLMLQVIKPNRKPPDKPQKPVSNFMIVSRKRKLDNKKNRKFVQVQHKANSTRQKKLRLLLLALIAAQQTCANRPHITVS